MEEVNMSKLGDKIRKTMRVEAVPIGFRAVRPAKTPQLLVAALLDDGDPKKVAEATEKGAGVIILRGAAGKLEAAVEAAGEAACGIWPEVVTPSAAADFVVFAAESTRAAALLDDKTGYVLALKDGADDTFLRVLESLTLDAILVDSGDSPLTVEKQVRLRRIAALTRKPLMLPVSVSVESGELECLRDAGVSVLLLDAGDKETLANIPSLLKTVDDLPEPRRRREMTLEALLPRAAEMAAVEDDDDDDDESDG